MDWEILVVAETLPGYSARIGEVAVARPLGHRWSKAELSSRFARVSYTGTRHEVRELCRGGYTYDFKTRLFTHDATGQVFDKSVVVTQEEVADIEDPGLEAIASRVDSKWRGKKAKALDFLHPQHLPVPDGDDYKEVREYWFGKFRRYSKDEHIHKILAALTYCCGSVFADLGSSLPKETQAAIFADENFTSQDIAWLKKVWRVKDGD